MPDVPEDEERLVGSVDEAAEEEGRDEDDAVVELEGGASFSELVEEPVDVEEGRREFPEDEVGCIEVDKGALYKGNGSC